jgi:hypothetical protein
LTAPWCLVPLADELVDRLTGGSTSPPPHPEFEFLSQPVHDEVVRLSVAGPVAYVEAEYWAGSGVQAAVVFEAGKVVCGPRKADIGPISDALRALGASREAAVDEFAAVGLGQHRRTEDWPTTEPSLTRPPAQSS